MCALALALLAGLALPARAAYMIPSGVIRPKDFTLVKQAGVYHLFYIRHDVTVVSDSTEHDFGHAISTDLYHWTQLPPVLPVSASGWDDLHVWAPSIVLADGVYWMFYTGVERDTVTGIDTQRIGVATSTDLLNWNRMDTPVLAATNIPWVWSNPLSEAPAFRDPYVMADPAHPGEWLMYATESLASDTVATVVGVAGSNGDLTHWSDLGPLLITWRNYTFNPLTESPHLFQHAGLWYLFITTSSGQPLTFYTSYDPVGLLPAWTYRGRMRNMLGYDTSLWFASEEMRDGTHDYFAFVAGDRIEIREILWSSGVNFSLLQPPLYHVLSMDWNKTNVAAGDDVRLDISSVNTLAGQPDLVPYVIDSLGKETAIPADSIGLPEFPYLTVDQSELGWTARRFPRVPDSDTVTVTHLRLRLADSTAATGILAIGPPPPPVPPGPPPNPIDDPGNDPTVRLRFGIRPLATHGFAGAPSLLVELPNAAAAEIDVFDLAGRRLRNLAARTLPRGASVLAWDGRDAAGRLLGRGVYFVRLLAGSQRATTRLVLMNN